VSKLLKKEKKGGGVYRKQILPVYICINHPFKKWFVQGIFYKNFYNIVLKEYYILDMQA
jgi:hypothetical protein